VLYPLSYEGVETRRNQSSIEAVRSPQPRQIGSPRPAAIIDLWPVANRLGARALTASRAEPTATIPAPRARPTSPLIAYPSGPDQWRESRPISPLLELVTRLRTTSLQRPNGHADGVRRECQDPATTVCNWIHGMTRS
jgi:hypothetical protein